MTTFVQQAVDISKQGGASSERMPRPLPAPKNEAWRLSQLKRLKQISLQELAQPFEFELFQIEPDGGQKLLGELPPGVRLSFGAAAGSSDFFSGYAYSEDEFYEDLPQLFPHRSVVIHIDNQYENKFPLFFKWSPSAHKGAGTELAPLFVVWEISSGAHLSAARSVLLNPQTVGVVREFFKVGADSKVEFVSCSERRDGIYLESKFVDVARGASFSHLVLDLGEAYSRQAMTCQLAHEGAECHVLGAIGLAGQDISEYPIVMDHLKPHTQSRQLFKSVLGGSARAVMNGRVLIRKDAQKVDSSQYNKNLLLSRSAYVHSKPELRVAADDVKAAHGATTGQVRPEEVFYLKSRGILEERALELIAAGFLREVVEGVPHPVLREWAYRQLEQRMPRILSEGTYGPA